MLLSIIIPAYNEEMRLERSLNKIIDFCKNRFENDYEIIVIDDGSIDKTRDIAKRYNARINKQRDNRGKGFSIREGVGFARGDYILYTDSDLSTPIDELAGFLKLIKKYDIVIGSRALESSNVKTRLHKKVFGRISNVPISFFLVKGIKDTQCGFKLFRRDVAKKLFFLQTIDRWGFDFEILYLAQRFNYSIKEQGVRWVEDAQSKVTLSAYPKTLSELVKIKFNEMRGVYEEKR